MGQNYALKFSNKVDERFYRDSQAMIGTNKDYDWSGVKTVKVYQVDTVALTDYSRSGSTRYGQATDLGTTIQEMTLSQDKAFTFVIDKGDKNESMMVTDAGKALAREEREVLVPFVDTYIFNKQASAAIGNSQVATAAATNQNAYSLFLKANEVLGNKNVLDSGRVAFCSYSFCGLLMQDPAFIKYSDRSQEMVIKGVLGEVDGIKIVKVPASRLPYGTSFLIVHQMATVAPQTLKEFKTHQDPPGISGWLVEGRFIFDAFVLDGKKDCLYLGMHEGATPGDNFAVASVEGTTSGHTVVSFADSFNLATGWKAYVKAASGTAPAPGNYNSDFDTTGWTEMKDSDNKPVRSMDITTTDGYKFTIAIVYGGKLIAAGNGTADVK